jgi:hypothetical protein
MKAMILALGILLVTPQITWSESSEKERLYDRIDQLQRENERLREENLRLRQNRYRSNYSYRGQSSLRETNQRLNELNRMKDSWERLTD